MPTLPFETIKHDILIKQVQAEQDSAGHRKGAATTDEKFGCKPDKIPADVLINYGIVNINKPKGPTSHMVSEYVQKILGITKAGHSGTLDPAVTGVLPVALGRATRIVQTLLNAGKEYVCIMHIHKPVPEQDIKKTINSFVGKITQLPPVRSAVVRQLRQRDIYYLNILEIKGQEVLFRVGCQAGTYIRKLCHDIGIALKVGAHMAELIRTKAGPFNFDTAVTLQDLEDALWYWKNEKNDKFLRHCIQPVESGVSHLPKIWIMDSAVDSICHGAQLNAPGIVKLTANIQPSSDVAIMTLKEELVALAQAKKSSSEIRAMPKGLAAIPTKVFMLPNTYPKMLVKN